MRRSHPRGFVRADRPLCPAQMLPTPLSHVRRAVRIVRFAAVSGLVRRFGPLTLACRFPVISDTFFLCFSQFSCDFSVFSSDFLPAVTVSYRRLSFPTCALFSALARLDPARFLCPSDSRRFASRATPRKEGGNAWRAESIPALTGRAGRARRPMLSDAEPAGPEEAERRLEKCRPFGMLTRRRASLPVEQAADSGGCGRWNMVKKDEGLLKK